VRSVIAKEHLGLFPRHLVYGVPLSLEPKTYAKLRLSTGVLQGRWDREEAGDRPSESNP
jgi:hypothetical protein